MLASRILEFMELIFVRELAFSGPGPEMEAKIEEVY